jgi:hypothetical protein
MGKLDSLPGPQPQLQDPEGNQRNAPLFSVETTAASAANVTKKKDLLTAVRYDGSARWTPLIRYDETMSEGWTACDKAPPSPYLQRLNLVET